MNEINGLTINESWYELEKGGRGKIAVFMYYGEGNPKAALDMAVSQYVRNEGYNELIDANLDNPWMRVVISDINDMKQEVFDPNKHRLNR